MSTDRMFGAALAGAAVSAACAFVLAGCPGRLDDIERYRPKDGGIVCPDIPEAFAARCAGATCHGATNPAASLDLVSANLEERVLGQVGKSCPGVLVDPSDPEGSLMFRKLVDPVPACGLRMPLGGAPFSADEIECVKAWISSLDDGAEDAGCPQCVCTPGAVEACYSGPAATEDIGACKAGTRTCNPEGLTWGACVGEVLPAPEACDAPEDEDCDGQAPPCPAAWSRAFGDVLTQYARAVGVDAAGNVFVAGDFEGMVDFGGGVLAAEADKNDVFVVKLDRFGNHLWSKKFGDASNQYAYSLAVDAEGAVILTGRVYGAIDFGGGLLQAAAADDVFVAKLDADGAHVWSRVFGDNFEQRGDRVAVDAAGNAVVIGQFVGTLVVGGTSLASAGAGDAFAFALAGATGDPLWALSFGGAGDDHAHGVSVTASGEAFVAGHFSGAASLAGAPVTSAGLRDAFIAKIDATGNVSWSKAFGGTGEDVAFDVDVDGSNGDAVVAGYFSAPIDLGGGLLPSAGSRDFFVARLSASGGYVFGKAFGDAADQLQSDYEPSNRMSVAVDAQGAALVTGPLFGAANFGGGVLTSAGKTDVFLVRLGKAGEHLSSKIFGNVGTQISLDIAAADGHAIIAGRFLSVVDFGFGAHTSAGDSDAFVAKILP